MAELPCTRMRTCCGCFDTGKGTVLTALATIAAALLTFTFIIICFFYWDAFAAKVRSSYEEIGFGADFIDLCVKVLWWGNVFTLIAIVVYIILCILLIVGVRKEQYKHMIPWIAMTTVVLPFFIFSFIAQLIFGFVGGSVASVWVPAIIVLIWCILWTYGYFCAVSHYRALKGDIHRPVTTLFARRN